MDTYHVVCHQCPEEAILYSEGEAESLVETHRADAGHEMEVGVISVPHA